MSDERWIEVSQSQFTHETEGLQYLKSKLPQHPPYRAWTNFEFRDGRGRWHEVDALVLTQSRLHLVELKHYIGRLRGNDHLWIRDGRRAEDSPLLLARRKAQYLASKLKDELRALAMETGAHIGDERKVIPFIQEAVFLHHENFISDLPEPSTINLYGLDEREKASHLPGISHLLLDQRNNATAIGPNQEAILTTLLERIGLVQRREREIGSWVIEENAIDEGPGWQDWRGYHKIAREQLARIRFQVLAPGAPASQQAEYHKIAQHEFNVMSKLSHDGILAPRDLIEGDLGVGLVYNFTESTERLDLWLASQNGLALERQLKLIHEVGDTLDYAHSHGVVHRGLSPRAVWIRAEGMEQRAQIGDWKSAGLAEAERTTGDGVTHLARDVADNVEQAWLTEAFQAPEDRWARNADRVRIDVFGMGALAYFILTGKPPARSVMALGERTRTQNGLDLSIDLPEIPEPIRQAVLKATRPAPGERTVSIRSFLQDLDAVLTPAPTDVDESVDPLEAKPGTALAGRFTVVKRLGRGSTAMGLLVRDAADDGSERVLKVALNEKAAERLLGEAEILRKLKGSRLVKLVKGNQPLTVEGRECLLLENAGTQTLGEVLRGQRLSLDYLERYGSDLLEALVQLDAAGVDHRDIKPSNLGVRERRTGKHLVLFDFSLSRASAAALHAGTPPYLDPFLGGTRQVFDSAAERYSAAVVLFEMATGHTPFYGDPMANPASVRDDATIDPSDFDGAVRNALEAFFRKALARDASERHHTAQQMLELWQSAFSATPTPTVLDADRQAEAASLETPLRDAGFSARALSAVEHLGVHTVGDLVALEPVRLNHLAGSADSTRKEVKSRASAWRRKFGTQGRIIRGTRSSLPSPRVISETLEAGSGAKRSTSKLELLRSILGLTGTADAFATHGALGAALQSSVSSARVNQLLGEIQDAWASNTTCLETLQSLGEAVDKRLGELGGVATTDELTDAVLGATALEGSRGERRLAEGLLRIIAVDRARALKRAEADGGDYELRRRGGAVVLIARSTALLDLAEQLGHEADRLLAQLPGDHSAPVPAERVAVRLAETATSFSASAAQSDMEKTAQLHEEFSVLTSTARLVQLAAAMSREGAASGAAELYHRDLTQAEALHVVFRGLAGAQRISRNEVKDRVRIRFPAVAELPGDSRLDALVEAAGLDLRFNPAAGVYESRDVSAGEFSSSLSTHTRMGDAPISGASVVVQRLRDSVVRRSFLGIGVKATRAADLIRTLETEFGAATLNLTDVLIEAMRALAAEGKSPAWERLAAADAQPVGSRDHRGLTAVVSRALPHVEERIAALAGDDARQRPVLLIEASPLARYGHVDLLRRWSDMTLSRKQAVWVLLPQTDANQGPLLDGSPVLTSPNQFLAVDSDWISAPGTSATYEGAAT